MMLNYSMLRRRSLRSEWEIIMASVTASNIADGFIMKVNMLTRVNMETRGGFRECALNRSIQLAKAHVQSCQQTCYSTLEF